MFGSTLEGVEKACGYIGLKAEEDGLDSFEQIASIQAAWQSAKVFQTADDSARAEKKIMGLSSTMKVSEYSSLRVSYERLHGQVPDTRLPGTTLLERMEAEAEEGEITAPRLNEIPSRQEVIEAGRNKNDSIGIAVTFTSSGAKLLQPVRVKLSMPETTELFRDRIRLLGAAVEFMKIRLPQSALWASSTEKLWNDHAEHILGPKVLGREMHDSDGIVTKTPSWQLALHYEFEIRNKACQFMNRGHMDNNNAPMDIAAALSKATLCPELRQEQFLERFQLQSQRASSSSSAPVPNKQQSNNNARRARGAAKERTQGGKAKGGAKGKDKKVRGKDKKTAKGGGKGKLPTQHNGKQICFAYHEQKCAGGCGREHVCQHCFKNHINSKCEA
jgi:hypothetical protein